MLILARNNTLPVLRNSYTTSRKNANLIEQKHRTQTDVWCKQRSLKYTVDANLAQKQSKMFSEVEIEIYKVFKEQS